MRRLTIRRKPRPPKPERGADEREVVEVDTAELGGLFAAPEWLRDLGMMAWLLVGVMGLLAGIIWLLSLTQTIVMPVLTAGILAAVLSPVVGFLQRRGMPRGAGTAIVLLLIVVAGIAVTVMVLSGISSQTDSLTAKLSDGAAKLQGWLADAGVDKDTAQHAKDDASSSASSAFHALIGGLGKGIETLGSLVVFLSFTILSLVFLLKDGPVIRGWTERHMGVPHDLARVLTGRVLGSLRGYFGGVTAIAAFNALVVGVGAVILGVPLAGSIAVVTFVGAYIPYLGAWAAGGFTVLVALGGSGTEAALGMAVITLLANGALQQVIQPIAFGAALGIHPLAVLIVTIAGGALFGTIGLILAAPLTSAVIRISSDLARARAKEEEPAEPEPSAGAAAAPAAGA